MATYIDLHSGSAVGAPDTMAEAEPLIRPARADDADEVRRMHLRSSAASRQRRYLSGLRAPSDANLRRLLEPPGGITLLAAHLDPRSGEQHVVAMANLLVEGDLGEVAVLVEDAWQRRGIGTVLLRGLIAYADRGGFAALVAHTAADNVAMLRTLRRLGFGAADRDGPMVSVTLPLAARHVRSTCPDPASGHCLGGRTHTDL